MCPLGRRVTRIVGIVLRVLVVAFLVAAIFAMVAGRTDLMILLLALALMSSFAEEANGFRLALDDLERKVARLQRRIELREGGE